jgi:hypothetical protein
MCAEVRRSMDLDEKFTCLAERLGVAFNADRSQRQQYVRALLAISDFLEDIKSLSIYSDQFRILAFALNELDDGQRTAARCLCAEQPHP